LAITFDDGYRDNHDLALPILARLGLPATFFVATGYLDGGCMFNDTVIEAVRAASGDTLDCGELGVHSVDSNDAKRAAIGAILDRVKYFEPGAREAAVRRVAEAAKAQPPHDLMMSSTQVAALHGAGMAIGGHTVTHPILTRVDIATARDEIDRGRRVLEELVGSRVRLFAYPNGRPHLDYAAAHEDLVREAGFDGAVSTAHGAAATGDNPYQIPRFTPWDREDWKFGLRLAANRVRKQYQTA
jgi:peptidoglycan/xylan/chitin deacetylase (PgdA/CDA1 family)